MPDTNQLTVSHPMSGAIPAPSEPAKLWFAAYTTARHEKHVAELLTERNIEIFLPLYRTSRQWKKSSEVVLELPLFPSYIFVRVERSSRGAVLGLPGVLSIVGSSKDPWPLCPTEIEALRLGLKTHRAEPHPFLVVGEKVRVKAGVMSGLEGILIRRKSEFRFVLTLNTLMKSVALEVDASDLEPIEPDIQRNQGG